MLKKITGKFLAVSSALLIASGLFSGCSDVLEVNGEAGVTASARAAEATGSRVYAYIDAFESTADRVQFRLKNVDIKAEDTISLYVHYNNYDAMPEGTTLNVRDGKAGTKWGNAIALAGKPDDWYSVSGIKATTNTDVLGFTFSGTGFNKDDIIVIKEITVTPKNGTARTLKFAESDWERWSKPGAMTFKLNKKLVKVATSSSTSWDQTNKFQFMINKSVEAGETVVFYYKPCANADTVTIRGVTSGEKWKNAENIEDKDDWNYVEFKTTAFEEAIGVTIYVTANSTSQTVHIKDFRIGNQRYNVLSASPYFASPAVINSGVVYSENGAFADEQVVIENPPVNNDDVLKTASAITSGKISEVKFLTAGPAHDMSNAITVSWLSPMPKCKLVLTASDGSTIVKYADGAIKAGTTKLPWSKGEQYYSFNETVEGLKASETYTYKVYWYNGSSITSTQSQTFKTSDGSSSFKFLIFSDLHRGKNSNDYIANVNNAVTNTKAIAGSDTAFSIFNGDMVNRGYNFSEWMEYDKSDFLKNGTVAFNAGNHEYKPEDSSDSRSTKNFFTSMAAIPAETIEGAVGAVVDSNYWYIYNKVLFIHIDSSAASYSSDPNPDSSSKQAAWVEKVIKANKSKVNFIVAVRHSPFYIMNYSSGKLKETGSSNTLTKMFDKFHVDLVITSDHHAYNRTNPLNGDKVTGSSDGTVYVITPITQGSSVTRYLTAHQESPSWNKLMADVISKIAKYDHYDCVDDEDGTPPEGNIGSSVGGCYVEVKSDKLIWNYVARDKSGNPKVVDSVSIPKRSH